MLPKRGRRAIPVLAAVALTLLLAAERAQAQCRGGQQQNRSGQSIMPMQSPMVPPYAMQQYAMLIAAQQQAVLRAQQRPQQQAVLAALPRQQPQPNPGAAQLRAVPMPERDDPSPEPEDPEDTAARQLRLVRRLVADADAVQREGERDSAAKIRERAVERLRDIAAKFRGTRAAGEARELLQKLGL